MKVEMQEILRSAHASTVQKNEETQKGRFGKILEESMKISSETKAEGAPRFTPGLTSIGDVQLTPMSVQDETPVVEKTNQLLDVLDEYRQVLADRRIPTGDIKPIINKINQQTENLTTGLDALPEGSPLKDIANQALMVSSLEVMKFSRGDYDLT
ncbi:MAG: hypothetical protein R6U38_08210 [Desulfatiglandaceae bacterium]